ncbi:MAG: radical SAM protein [Euryarchaeota archaeon]|jgi:pyruvate formate lyase activating enzyme|nr:radical SAM protein [Euryarchaeota archaeon]
MLMNHHYLKELKNCQLCPWKCGVNRLEGEKGACLMGLPEVAYTGLTPVLQSYSITLLGCSFRCLYCNAYRISQYPDSGWRYRGYVKPEVMAREAVGEFKSSLGRDLGVKRISFTGGEPSLHTPYLEEVSRLIQLQLPGLEVGVATNGFCTTSTMKRLAQLSNYINFEIKAWDTELHQAITGAPVEPVLRNAKWIAQEHPEKIRVFRTVVIPGINQAEVIKIARFIAELDPTLPYRLVGFRPHFMLYYHPAPTRAYLQNLVEECREAGLEQVDFSGYYPGSMMSFSGHNGLKTTYQHLNQAGCYRKPRNCGTCPENHHCPALVLEPWTNPPPG